MYHPPQVDECDVEIKAPEATGLVLRAWELRLSDNPDASKGEIPWAALPAEITDGYVAVVWDGEIDVQGGSSVSDCQGGNRLYAVSGGAIIALPAGVSAARVALLGIDNAHRTIRGLLRGSHPFPDIADLTAPIRFILRDLDFTNVSEEIEIEEWPRPGIFLTTVDGPRTCGGRDPSPPTSELDFVTLEARLPQKLCPGSEATARILDYHVDGDRTWRRIPFVDGSEQGCKIRCWGS